MQNKLMYAIDLGWIAIALLIAVLLVIELGFRLGLKNKDSANEASRTQINATQSSTLGILALLLAFTFSLSVQRFESRSDAIVEEANAIGTTYLRADLLPIAQRSEVKGLLRDYVAMRVSGTALSVVRDDERSALLAGATRVQTALWDQARRAAESAPNAATTGLFTVALNDMIDSYGRCNAAVNRRVPEVVVYLLYGTFLIAGAIVGIACGVGGQRLALPSVAMIVLIVALIFVILDLDRPRRGLITVSQESLLELQASMR